MQRFTEYEWYESGTQSIYHNLIILLKKIVEPKMNFVLSYFRLTLFQLYLELRETEKRSNSFEIRLESLFPYTFPLPPPSSPPPRPHLPSWKSMPEARRGPRNHRVRVPIFQYRLGARTPRKFGRSISGKWTGFRLETRNSFHRAVEK